MSRDYGYGWKFIYRKSEVVVLHTSTTFAISQLKMR